MSEIKTCEEYVLSLLKDAQDHIAVKESELESVKREKEMLLAEKDAEIKVLRNDIETLLENITYNPKAQNYGIIWSDINPKEFNEISEVLERNGKFIRNQK